MHCLQDRHTTLEGYPPPVSSVPGLPLDWCGEWLVDGEGGGKAADGWQYALNWNTGWLAHSSAFTLVRRRRWVRHAQLSAPSCGSKAAPPLGSHPQLPPSLLESDFVLPVLAAGIPTSGAS